MRASPSIASLWMIGSSLAFAGMAACIKLASQHDVAIVQIVLFRGLISVVVTGGFLLWRGIRFATPHWRAHAERGIVGFLGTVTYVAAVAMLPLPSAVTLNYTSPAFLALLLLIVHRERPEPLLLLSMVAGLGGIILLLRPSYDTSQLVGGAIAIASAILAALTALNIRALGRLDEPASRTVFFFSLSIVIGALPWFLLSHPASLDPEGVVYVLGAGLAGIAGHVMLTLAYQRGHTMLVALLGYSQIVFTSLLGMAMWNDRPKLLAWIGMGLVMASGIVARLSSQSDADSPTITTDQLESPPGHGARISTRPVQSD
jgi:S-adenosylmethionine uptake transporter